MSVRAWNDSTTCQLGPRAVEHDLLVPGDALGTRIVGLPDEALERHEDARPRPRGRVALRLRVERRLGELRVCVWRVGLVRGCAAAAMCRARLLIRRGPSRRP